MTRHAGADHQRDRGAAEAEGGGWGRWRGVIGAALLASALALAPGVTAQADTGACTTTSNQVQCIFGYTGAAQSWTVPAGVTQAAFDVYGAQGGSLANFIFGGDGGETTATLAVSPGATVSILVGGQGQGDACPGGGGFNGGGASGGGACPQAGGGGASDVRIGGTDLAERVLVAGGGGGAAGVCGPACASGGAGGGLVGGTGGCGAYAGCPGGTGGDQTGSSGSGQLGQGSVGISAGDPGGGGGGGYYGGAGGSLAQGGGGGSGFATPAATSVTLRSGVRPGNGQVIITYPYTDTVPPTASPTQTPAADAAGWNNSNVTVNWNWADNPGGSGIDSANCPPGSTSSGEGTLVLTATCKDLAGNVGNASYTVKVDKTPPNISAAATTAPNAAGWYNSNVTVHFTCADALSGIATGACPGDQVLSTEGSAVSSTVETVTDIAGNTSSPSNVVTVKLDKTSPTISASATKADGTDYTAGVWTNQAVTVHFACADTLSGVPSCPADQVFSAEGVTPTTSGTVTDLAGNSASVSFGPIQVDKTAPVTTTTPAPGTLPRGLPLLTVVGTATVQTTAGATLGAMPFTCFDTRGLQVDLAGVDAGGSGVADLTYAAKGAQVIATTTVAGASAQPGVTSLGLTTLTYAARDTAGNAEASQSETVIVGPEFSCAGPTPGFSLPVHGILTVTGTATIDGHSVPFSQSFRF